MVDRMLAAGIPRVVLITPPPVYDEGRVRHQQQRMGTTEPVAPDRTDAHAARYAEAVRALGARRRLPVLDLHAALRREPGWQTALLADGLHFTPAGQALVGRLLVELLEREYPDELRCGVHRARARVCRWGDFVCLGGVDQRVVTAGVLTITSAILTRPPPPSLFSLLHAQPQPREAPKPDALVVRECGVLRRGGDTRAGSLRLNSGGYSPAAAYQDARSLLPLSSLNALNLRPLIVQGQAGRCGARQGPRAVAGLSARRAAARRRRRRQGRRQRRQEQCVTAAKRLRTEQHLSLFFLLTAAVNRSALLRRRTSRARLSASCSADRVLGSNKRSRLLQASLHRNKLHCNKLRTQVSIPRH